MKLIDFFQSSSGKNIIEEIKSITQIEKTDPLEFYMAFTAYLEKKMSDYLMLLSSEEAFAFYMALQEPGIEIDKVATLFYQNREKIDFYPYIDRLKKRALVYTLKTSQKITPKEKLFIFDEVKEIIEKKNRIIYFQNIKQEIMNFNYSILEYQYPTIPFEIQSYFFSYGLYCRADFILQNFGNDAVNYFIEEGVIKPCIVFYEESDSSSGRHCQFYLFYMLNPSKIVSKKTRAVRTHRANTRFFNDIIRILFFLKKEKVITTQKGDIHKRSFDKLAKEFHSESMLFFLLNFLTQNHYIGEDEKENQLVLRQKAYQIFKKNIQIVYNQIIRFDELFLFVYDIIEQFTGKDFAFSDVILQYVKINLKNNYTRPIFFRDTRRNVLFILEIFCYMGILTQKYSEDGFVFYSFNPGYKNLTNATYSPDKPLILSPNMEITAYANELDLNTSYVLNVFAEIVQFEDMMIYKLTPESIKRALYFGLEVEILLETLKKRAKNSIPENMIANIERWKTQFKKGFLEETLLLKTEDPSVLSLLLNHPVYKKWIKEKISDYYAIVSKEFLQVSVLEDLNIYLQPLKKMKEKKDNEE